MDINVFIEKFGEQFDETDISLLKPETNFKDLDEWSSLIALSVIAMVDEEYNIILKGQNIRECKTIQDLYNCIKAGKQ